MNYKAFRSVVKTAKQKFFNDHIVEVSESNKHSWDLMGWVKEHKNPPCKAIQFNGQLCHNMALWDALNNTYNSVADRPVDLSILSELQQELSGLRSQIWSSSKCWMRAHPTPPQVPTT